MIVAINILVNCSFYEKGVVKICIFHKRFSLKVPQCDKLIAEKNSFISMINHIYILHVKVFEMLRI